MRGGWSYFCYCDRWSQTESVCTIHPLHSMPITKSSHPLYLRKGARVTLSIYPLSPRVRARVTLSDHPLSLGERARVRGNPIPHQLSPSPLPSPTGRGRTIQSPYNNSTAAIFFNGLYLYPSFPNASIIAACTLSLSLRERVRVRERKIFQKPTEQTNLEEIFPTFYTHNPIHLT